MKSLFFPKELTTKLHVVLSSSNVAKTNTLLNDAISIANLGRVLFVDIDGGYVHKISYPRERMKSMDETVSKNIDLITLSGEHSLNCLEYQLVNNNYAVCLIDDAFLIRTDSEEIKTSANEVLIQLYRRLNEISENTNTPIIAAIPSSRECSVTFYEYISTGAISEIIHIDRVIKWDSNIVNENGNKVLTLNTSEGTFKYIQYGNKLIKSLFQ